MRAKVIGILVFLVLIVAIVVTGLGAVSQAVSVATDTTGSERLGPAFAQYTAASNETDNQDENAIYSTFTFVCPFH
jgi:hypothetical protein